jgi:hypothetical protein
MNLTYSRQQLIREAAFTDEDLVQIRQCRRTYNQLGFAYQVGFVRLLNRFPLQESFELIEELLAYVSAQLELPAPLIELYQQRRQTIAEHQLRIMGYLKLRRLARKKPPAWSGLSSRRLAGWSTSQPCRHGPKII